jgi:predicted SnoaL-like aldol condensation-catalyzing enzyme
MIPLSSGDCEASERIRRNNSVNIRRMEMGSVQMQVVGTAIRFVNVLVLALTLVFSAQPAWVDEALTARNKALVRDFYTTVLVGRDVDAAPRFLRTDYIQHNPQVPTGLKGFMDTFRERFAQKLPADYKRELLNVIGDNDMVVVYVRQTWTGRDGQRHQALGFDMFRVQDSMIAEHWDAD